MKIQLIDYGYVFAPNRAHANDAGADVYLLEDVTLGPAQTLKLRLGFGIALPDGLMGLIIPRSSMAKDGIITQIPPIDSGYRGEIHAIVTNTTRQPYRLSMGDRIAQLVIMPFVVAEFKEEVGEERGENGFGSTGK